MKKSILLLAAAVAIASCSTETPTTETTTTPKKEAKEMTLATTGTLPDTITSKTFNTWKKKWQGSAHLRDSLVTNDTIKYFSIPKNDLIQLLKEQTIDSVHIYLGIEQKNNMYLPKLMLLGVDSTGKELTSDGIYDLSRACPPYCKE